MKKIISIVVCMVLLPLFSLCTFAKEDISNTVEIKYFRDSNQNIAVEGSIWRLYKIADVINDSTNSIDTLKVVSHIDNIKSFENVTTNDVLKEISHEYIDESTLDIVDVTKDNKKITYYEGVTDNKGLIRFDNLARGVYFGVEVKSARHYLLSQPFIVTLPSTYKNESVNKIVIEPKAILANDLIIKKEISGNLVHPNDAFELEVNLPIGKYRYQYPDGESGYIKDGDKIFISNKRYIQIFDVLANGEFKITEVLANKIGYTTTYKNNEGIIQSDSENICIIKNHRHLDDLVDTGDIGMNFISIIFSLLIIIICSYVYKKVHNKEV